MRTLLIRPGAIGDCIRCFPEMEALRGEHTEVWVPGAIVPLVLFANRVRSIATTGLDLAGLPGMPLPPELYSFDRVYSWYGTGRDDFREAVAQLPFTFFPALPSTPPSRRAAHSDLRARGTARIVIHPFSGSTKKNWPLDHFRALAAELGEVAWTCGPEDALDGATRFENLADLARWLSGASLFIGNDSGITHLAAAVGTPTLALFGPSDPAIWCPAGKRVRWMRFASPAEAAAIAREMLR